MLHLHVLQCVVEIGVEEQPDLPDGPFFAQVDADRRRSVVGGRDPAVGLYVGPEVAVEEVFSPEAGQRRGEFERDVFPFGTALWTPEFERSVLKKTT